MGHIISNQRIDFREFLFFELLFLLRHELCYLKQMKKVARNLTEQNKSISTFVNIILNKAKKKVKIKNDLMKWS